nr:MarR family transcriptional regulator [Micromonospora sp. DSM 115978]
WRLRWCVRVLISVASRGAPLGGIGGDTVERSGRVTGGRRRNPQPARLGHLIKRCEQALIGAKSRALRAVGLTVPQYVALLSLSESPGQSGAQLARQCMVTPQSMASLLATLENKKLITRTPSDVHANIYVSRLTRRGQSLLREADREGLRVEGLLTDAFTAEEMAQFREYLNRAVAALATE